MNDTVSLSLNTLKSKSFEKKVFFSKNLQIDDEKFQEKKMNILPWKHKNFNKREF